jgi:hypothetical protein
MMSSKKLGPVLKVGPPPPEIGIVGLLNIPWLLYDGIETEVGPGVVIPGIVGVEKIFVGIVVPAYPGAPEAEAAPGDT